MSIFQLNVIRPVIIVRVKLKSKHLLRGQTTVIVRCETNLTDLVAIMIG